MLKSQTSLPYARRAAELLWGTDAVVAAARETDATPGGLGRRHHFELRARSIDEGLERCGARRILELAAGLSFRGLDFAVRQPEVFYLDTDLPEIVSVKTQLVAQLRPEQVSGTVVIQSLDALDSSAFAAAIDKLPAGRISIVQEGLLMYLDANEKAALAANVGRALRKRGGAWITADIYVRSKIQPVRDERTQAFLERHHVEDNKFASWTEATSYFTANGLRVTERIAPDPDPWPVRQTWVVEAS